MSNRTFAASAAILAPLAVALAVPVVSDTGGAQVARAADTPPASAAGTGTTGPTGPTDPVDPTDDAEPTDPDGPTGDTGPTDPDDPTDDTGPTGTDGPSGPTGPKGVTSPPTATKSPSLTITVKKQVARKRLSKGLAVRLKVKSRERVAVKLRGPGRVHKSRKVTFGPGTRKLTLKPHMTWRTRHGHGKKLVLVVTATVPNGGHVMRHKTIKIGG
jgi:hypothetical protein